MHGLRASRETASDTLKLAERCLATCDAADAARLVSVLLGPGVEVGDASRYLVRYARQQGYDIPAFAYAGCGEMKQFYRDQGVRDDPGWYEKLGVPHDEARFLYDRTIIVVRDFSFRRMAIVLRGSYHHRDGGFCSLAESGLIERLGGEPGVGAPRVKMYPGEGLDDILRAILAFVLRGETGGRPTF